MTAKNACYEIDDSQYVRRWARAEYLEFN